MLQADEIEFSPALSRSKWDAIRGIGMGDVIKVAVRCEPVWGGLGFIQSDTDIPVWWPLPSKVADDVIIGWAAGPAAGALRGRDIKQIAWSSLRRLFPRIRASPGDVCVVDWGEEPFTLGAYSYDRSAHGRELRHELARPEDGLLFFAGEATEPLFYGTVHGAVKSGQTAADKVCRSLQA